MLISVAEIELKKFKDSKDALATYLEGKMWILKSGIINLLRTMARPVCLERGTNPNTGAYMAAFMEGYHKALDDLMYFEEIYMSEKTPKAKVQPMFGALEIAMSKGSVTKEEYKKYESSSK